MTQLADNVILLLAALLLVGVLSTKFSTRFGMPALVLFIAAGMVLSRFIYFNNAFLHRSSEFSRWLLFCLRAECRRA